MSEGWHPQDIIAAVRKRGTSLQRLGLEHGFERTTFNKALHHRFPRSHAIIAEFLGVPRHELWPHWYDPPADEPPPPSHIAKPRKAA